MINIILIFPTLSIFKVVRQPRLTVIEKASLFLCEPDRLLPGQAIYLPQHFIHTRREMLKYQAFQIKILL